jgi:G3E family GTPase
MKEGARILRSEYGKVSLPLILDVDCNNSKAYADLVQEEVEQTHHERGDDHDEHSQEDRHHAHEHHHHHSAHLDNDGFISVSFQSDRPFSLTGFQNFLDSRLPDDVFRAKGLLWFKESQLRYIFQPSGKRYDMATDEWKGTPTNQIVLIGRNLNPEQLNADLNNCLEPALAGAEAVLSS